MRKKSAIIIALCLLAAALLLGCGESVPGGGAQITDPASAPEKTQESAQEPTPVPTPEPIVFAGGSVPVDTEELCLVLREGETALLDRLPRLRLLDADGSICYEELCAWAREHPEVELRYGIPLPGLGRTEAGSEELDLRSLSLREAQEAARLLPLFPRLRELLLPDVGPEFPVEMVMELGDSAPDAMLHGCVSLYGQTVNLADTRLILFHVPVDDQGEAVRKILPYMRACTWVDMDDCGVDNPHMARIRDENPDMEVIWRVWFADNYSVRTNVTKILASKPTRGGNIKDSNNEGLYYCTNVRYLDLGHNEQLKDFGFIRNMPKLEIAVISMAAIDDLSPFASCPHLRYLEMGETRVKDLSPLAACKELRHLNIGTIDGLTDISPIYGLDLKRLWIGTYTPIPKEQVEKMQELHPNCDINTTVPSGLELDEDGGAANEGYTIEWKSFQLPLFWGDEWRPIGYYKVAFKCFRYDLGLKAYAFSWNDPKYTGDDPFVEPVNVSVIDTSFLLEDWVNPHSDEPDLLEYPPGETLYVLEH